MWALIAKYLGGIIANWRILILLSGLVMCGILLSLARKSGMKSAELEQLRDWSKYQAERAKDRAVIQSMDNRIARKRLRERWAAK